MFAASPLLTHPIKRSGQPGQDTKGSATLRHLYLHIPFCHKICPYCSFHKHGLGGYDLDAFVTAMVRELEWASRHWNLQPHSIYFGGGTPTALTTSHLENLLLALHRHCDLSQLLEWSCEINPRTITAEKARCLSQHGVTRASLGVQAWDDSTLRTLGRDHSPAEALASFELLRQNGFAVLSLDLMFSVPGQSSEDWQYSLEQSLALRPDHLSAYNLNYEEDTEFFEQLRQGQCQLEPQRDADYFQLASSRLSNAGYEHYEISNYALPGKRSLHNQAYWCGSDYLGFGPGAFSTVGQWRWKNPSDTKLYSDAKTSPQSLAGDFEPIGPQQRRTEAFAMRLRTTDGLEANLIHPDQKPLLHSLEEDGLLRIEDGHIRLTLQGRPLVDSIALGLLG